MNQTALCMQTQTQALHCEDPGQRDLGGKRYSLAQQDIDWNALPVTMARLKEVLGTDATLALIAAHGGGNLYVPSRLRQAHPLLQTLGPEAAARLARAYGGERVDVPKIDAVLRQLRKKDILAARKQGESIADLALRHKLSRRRVLQILAE